MIIAQDRLGSRDLAVARQVGLVERGEVKCEFDLHRALGLMQHHDAVTGTEKQVVAEDYSQRLDFSVTRCQEENVPKILKKVGLSEEDFDLSETSCPRLNISECRVSELSSQIVVLLYNPLSRPVTHTARVPITEPVFTVHDINGTTLDSQINQVPNHIKTIPGEKIIYFENSLNDKCEGRDSLANYEIIFNINLPALGYTFAYLHKTEEKRSVQKIMKTGEKSGHLQVLESVEASLEYYIGK